MMTFTFSGRDWIADTDCLNYNRLASLGIKEGGEMGGTALYRGLLPLSNQSQDFCKLSLAARVDPQGPNFRIQDAWTVGECITQLGLPSQNTTD